MMENISIEDQIETLRGVITRLCESNLDDETRMILIDAVIAYYPTDVGDALIGELSSIL